MLKIIRGKQSKDVQPERTSERTSKDEAMFRSLWKHKEAGRNDQPAYRKIGHKVTARTL